MAGPLYFFRSSTVLKGRGGGWALVRSVAAATMPSSTAARVLKDLPTANFDQKHGVEIMTAALTVPCKTIASNAGVEGAVVVGKLLESSDTSFGYNAQTGEYVNMYDAGIIDPDRKSVV